MFSMGVPSCCANACEGVNAKPTAKPINATLVALATLASFPRPTDPPAGSLDAGHTYTPADPMPDRHPARLPARSAYSGGDRKPLSFGFAKVLCWKSGGTIALHVPKVKRNYSSLQCIRLRRILCPFLLKMGGKRTTRVTSEMAELPLLPRVRMCWGNCNKTGKPHYPRLDAS